MFCEVPARCTPFTSPLEGEGWEGGAIASAAIIASDATIPPTRQRSRVADLPLKRGGLPQDGRGAP